MLGNVDVPLALASGGYEVVGSKSGAAGIAGRDPVAGAARVASLLGRWLAGTHQCGVHSQHLAYYLDEFTFRFNRRASKARGLLFFRLPESAVATPVVTYHTLVTARDADGLAQRERSG